MSLFRAKNGRKRPKRLRRSSQDGPRGPQKGPKTAQEGPETAGEGPKTAPREPRRPSWGHLGRIGALLGCLGGLLVAWVGFLGRHGSLGELQGGAMAAQGAPGVWAVQSELCRPEGGGALRRLQKPCQTALGILVRLNAQARWRILGRGNYGLYIGSSAAFVAPVQPMANRSPTRRTPRTAADVTVSTVRPRQRCCTARIGTRWCCTCINQQC